MATKTFKDEQGREWTPRVDGNVIFEYEARTGISIFKAMADNVVTGPIPGMRELMVLLWLSIEEKAKSMGISEVDFRKAIIGKTADDAISAIKDAVLDFFPPLRKMAEAFEAGVKTRLQASGLGKGPISSALP